MERLNSITPVFVDTMPEQVEHGKIYISSNYMVAVHLCACGCGGKVAMLLRDIQTDFLFVPQDLIGKDGWMLTAYDKEIVTFEPSIGNWLWEKPYHAHYYIRASKIVWD
jgi:hypothetical protein